MFLFAQGVRETVEALPTLNLCECHRGVNYGGTGGEHQGGETSERVPYRSRLGEPATFVDSIGYTLQKRSKAMPKLVRM
jgi:hypothetical protein